MEADLKENLDKISLNVERLAKNNSALASFGKGILSGFGSLVGFLFGIAILGLVLNALGVIPAFRSEVDSWKALLQQTQSFRTGNSR